MLDSFLKVAYAHDAAERHQDELVELMKKLPTGDLYKIASGQEKVAFGGDSLEWLERFKGTPLFEQAVQLEQESIQLEVAEKQQQEMNQESWRARDQIGLKKRLLALQLAQSQQQAMTGQPAAPAPSSAPSASPESAAPAAPTSALEGGAPSAKGISIKLGAKDEPSKTPSIPAQAAAFLLGGPGGFFGARKAHPHGEALEGAVRGGVGGQLGSLAGGLGARELAKALGAREGSALVSQLAGQLGGGFAGYKALTHKYNKPAEKEAAVKEAFNPASLLAAGKGLAAKAAPMAMNVMKNHPGAALGGAVGAAGGLASGMQKDEHGQRHLLRGLASGAVGGAAGAAAGHVAQGTRQLVGDGLGIGTAARTAATDLAHKVRASAINTGSNLTAGLRG